MKTSGKKPGLVLVSLVYLAGIFMLTTDPTAVRIRGGRMLVKARAVDDSGSMTYRPIPSRAEVVDIYNACADGAAAVMLTGETAQGKYPVEAVQYLINTVREAEKDLI